MEALRKKSKVPRGFVFDRTSKNLRRWYVSFEGIGGTRIKAVAGDTKEEALAKLKRRLDWVQAFRDGELVDEMVRASMSPEAVTDVLEAIGAAPAQTEDIRADVARRLKEKAPRATSMTVGQLAEMWLKAKSEKRSIEDDRQRFVEIVAFFGANEPIVSIDAGRVEAFRDHLRVDGAGGTDEERRARRRRKDKLSPGTINRYLQVLRGALRLAERRNNATSDPFRGISFVAEQNERDRLPTDDEIAALLAEAKGELRMLILLARWTAMRAGEILGLEWARIDLKRAVVRLEARHTKARKLRDVPLPPEAVDALRGAFKIGVERVFSMSIGTASSAFTKLCRRLGIKGLRLHDFRHLRLTELMRSNTNLLVLQAISGHRTLEMLKRYSHVTLEDMQRAVKNAERKA